MHRVDLIIIGAGPAGMAVAATAANGGAKVLILDEQPQAGGQIYRNVTSNSDRKSYLGKDYTSGSELVEALNDENIMTEFDASVWRIEAGSRVIWSQDGRSQISSAPHVLLAAGAQERPMPFPGWTLPGVMSAGAAQVLMKNSGLLPCDAVLAGSGPLLYLVAAQMIDAGTPPKALVETQSFNSMLNASRYLPSALLGFSTLIKGLGLIRKIKNAGVPRFTGASGFRVTQSADGGLSFVFKSNGREHNLSTSLLLTHQGVISSTHISRASGVPHSWNEAQQAYQPDVDEWGNTDLTGIHIAGDGVGIGGADAARAAGRLAALEILHQLGHLKKAERDRQASESRKRLRKSISVRPFLDAAYAPLSEFVTPQDDTIVCRCEEITAGAIRKSLDEGAQGVRQVKTATRAGMGPCQGRMCDLTVRGILTSCGAEATAPRARTPIKPVKLGELAALAPTVEG
jgi:thioredoxin reductase